MSNEKKAVQDGEEIIEELFQHIMSIKDSKELGVFYHTTEVNEALRAKLVIGKAWIIEQLKNFPRCENCMVCCDDLEEEGEVCPRSKWEEEFEKNIIGEVKKQ